MHHNANIIHEELINNNDEYARSLLNETETGIKDMKAAFYSNLKTTTNENNAFLPWAFTGGLGASQMLKAQ